MDIAHRGGALILLSLGRCVFSLLLFILLLPICSSLLPQLQSEQEAAAARDYLGVGYLTCMRKATSLSTTFTRNVDAALQNLTKIASQGRKYANITAGSGTTDMVYAMFQCRGDQTLELCSECMQNATARLPQSDCPDYVGARIQLDGCYLRYDSQSFFRLDSSYLHADCFGNTSDPVAMATIKDVVGNVTTLAPQQGGFASARVSGEYAMAQCLGYLSESECSRCLLANNNYSSVCESTLGATIYITSCYYRFEPYSFLEPLPPPPPPLPSAPPPLASTSLAHKSQGSKTAIIAAGVVVGVVILTAILCAIVVWRYKASRIKGVKLVGRDASWPRQLLQPKAQVFSLQELEEATGHFHATSKLGAGGFGVVYKGTLICGEEVAIKKLSIGKQEGNQEFLNEVNLITSVQHKNLIRLLGCCVEGPERILVYEYLPNKSLDFFLFGDSMTLNWSTRYGIILGMAKGLAYLHEESHIRIIHRDIKASNILLDDQLNPVIADFGLARLVKEDATHVNTRVAGTLGYVAPEYALCGDLSEKVDVFSFGLVCLEIVTGTKNLHGSLLPWVWENYQQGKSLDLVDEKLASAFTPEQAIRVVHVALLCTQENPKQRPAMSMATFWLSGTPAILEVPTRPTFLNYIESILPRGDVNHPFTSTSSSSSQSSRSGGQVSQFPGQAQSFSEIVVPR